MDRPPAEEGEWVRRALGGDDDAFARLVETYQVPVFNLCYRMLGDSDQAEDAAQEAFLRAYRNLAAYDLRRPFRTWVLSIAAHHAIDQIRRRKVPTIPLEDALDDSSPRRLGSRTGGGACETSTATRVCNVYSAIYHLPTGRRSSSAIGTTCPTRRWPGCSRRRSVE